MSGASELIHDWADDPDLPSSRHTPGSRASGVLSPQTPALAGVTDFEANPVPANPARGEAALRIAGEVLVLRPSFAALVAAEQEVGPLFALVERAADGRLGLGELAGLCWHCLRERPAGLTRAAFAEGLAAGGLAAAMPAVRVLLQQILSGR